MYQTSPGSSTLLTYVEQVSNYNIDDVISGGFKEVREPTELALSLDYRAKSYRDEAEKISWYYSRPSQDGLLFSPDNDKEYDIQRYHQYTLEK
jgi:hypothetical protein